MYLEFLVEHPAFTFGALRHVFVGGGIVGESLVDHTRSRMLATPGVDIVWPQEASRYTLALVGSAGLTACALWRRRRLDRRWLLPAAMIVSSVPHALLAYHASPYDIARHGVILSLVLVVACWWCIALGVDVVIARRSTGTVATSGAAPDGLRELDRVG
jgi:hypothetical protein